MPLSVAVAIHGPSSGDPPLSTPGKYGSLPQLVSVIPAGSVADMADLVNSRVACIAPSCVSDISMPADMRASLLRPVVFSSSTPRSVYLSAS